MTVNIEVLNNECIKIQYSYIVNAFYKIRLHCDEWIKLNTNLQFVADFCVVPFKESLLSNGNEYIRSYFWTFWKGIAVLDSKRNQNIK